MRITIFGIVWLLAILYAIYKKHPKYLVGLTLLSGVFQSASVLVLGDKGVGPMIITSAVMIAWKFTTSTVFNLGILRIRLRDKGKWISLGGIFSLMMIIIISKKVNHLNYDLTNYEFYLLFLQLLIYMGCYISLWELSYRITKDDIQKFFYGILNFVVVVGAIQFLITTNILPRNFIATTFLYTADTNSAYYWFDYYPRVFATFMEPSYCGAFLSGAFYYIISDNKENNYYRFLAIAVIVEIFLSFSSTSYISFALTGILYLVLSKNKKALRYLIPIGCGFVIILVMTGRFMNILNQVIFNKINSGSGKTRYGWDMHAWNMFCVSPIIGVGFKNIRASQFWLSIIAQVGILGFVSWCMIWFPLVYKAISKKKDTLLMSGVLFLLGVVCSMMIAIPDIDFCVFWIAMYFSALLFGVDREELKERIKA